MAPPFISYITFNRLGLTAKNLSTILSSTDDFEIHIIDCNSKDGTWDYIMSLDDSRIKSKDHLEINHGKTYALNMNLIRRSPDQYFFVVDNDVSIETNDWISKFLKVFEVFPEVGLLGVHTNDEYIPPVIPQSKDNVSYQELDGNTADAEKNYIPGNFMCLKPELIKELGYFCEENYLDAVDLTYRVCNLTDYKAGFVTDVSIQMPQSITCAACDYAEKCKLDKDTNTCFTKYKKMNKNAEFLQKNKWKFEETMRDMKSGARPAYCASLLDATSTKEHIYNMDWAMENFYYFIRNAN